MLKYTGHPLVDVGAAAIAAFNPVQGQRMEELTEEQLDYARSYIESHYGIEPFSTYTRILFPNSGYVNAGPEKRTEYMQLVLHGSKNGEQSIGAKCAFCGEEATVRAFRQHIPLVGGEQAFNFFAEGKMGLPICQSCLLSIQAFPLGSIKCNGKALIVHSTNVDLVYEFAHRFLIRNRELMGLGKDVMFPKTLLIEILLDIEKEKAWIQDGPNYALTAYHLTNFPTNADVNIYHLPMDCTDFIRIARTGKYKAAWDEIVKRAWREVELKEKKLRKPTKTSKSSAKQKEQIIRRNVLYEDLFSLPDRADHFLRVHLLGLQTRVNGKGQNTKEESTRTKANASPNETYSLGGIADRVSWDLVSLFLRKVINMDKVRIEAIRQLADHLAEFVQNQDSRLFTKVFNARRYRDLSFELLRANKVSVQEGNQPLFTFDQFVDIFEESEDTPRVDWSLARDLLIVRMIEQLHAAKWWDRHKDQLEEAVRDVELVD